MRSKNVVFAHSGSLMLASQRGNKNMRGEHGTPLVVTSSLRYALLKNSKHIFAEK